MTVRTTASAVAWFVACTALVGGCGLDSSPQGVAVVVPTTAAGRNPAGIDPAIEQALEPTSSLAGAAPTTLDDTAADAAQQPDQAVAASPGSGRPEVADLPDTVAVVGDSLTESAIEQITANFEGVGIEVLVVDGAENRRMMHGNDPPPGVRSVDQIAAVSAPEVWVIALGTNDVGAEQSTDQFRGDAAALLSHVPPGAPVVWVDLWIRDRQPAVEAANQQLRQLAAGRPDTVVADWFTYGDEHGLVTDDGVHLTSDGKHVFATLIVDAVYALFA